MDTRFLRISHVLLGFVEVCCGCCEDLGSSAAFLSELCSDRVIIERGCSLDLVGACVVAEDLDATFSDNS